MAKYSKKAQEKAGKVMHKFKKGELKNGSTGKTVKNRKQAIVIGLFVAQEAAKKTLKRKRFLKNNF